MTDKILQRPLGILVTKVKGSVLQNLLDEPIHHQPEDENRADSYGSIYIVNKDKLMIANSISSESIRFKQVIDTNEVQKVLTSREGFSGIYENYRGIQVLGTVMFVPETNWVILSEKSVKDAFLPLARIKYIFIISGGGAIFLVFIFAFVISGKINAIVNKLIRGTRRIAEGDLEHPITIGKRMMK